MSAEPVTLSAQEADAQGFRPLTNPYTPAERWMLDIVLADLRRANIEHVFVQATDHRGQLGLEVWRKRLS